MNRVEEVVVEQTAREWTERIARPRIAQEEAYGSADEALRLERLLEEAIEDSRGYVIQNGGRE